MRHINRLATPDILVRKQEAWQSSFLEAYNNGKVKRPDHSKYAHQQIVDTLNAMSFNKCFYCEGTLKGTTSEVDHFIEVADDPSLAFDWKNLYLSCTNCNNKLPHHTIPVTDALDPCRDSDDVIQQNITFRDEIICAVPNSPKGLKTIQKYKLDTEQLDYKRSKWLNVINREAISIQQKMIEEHRTNATPEEKSKLLLFMQPDQPYSLMSEIYIKTNFKNLIL